MKINWNSKYNTIAVYSIGTVCAVIVFYLSLSKIDILLEKIGSVISVLQPFFVGFLIAYLLDFMLRFLENIVFEMKWFKVLKIKSKRLVGLIVTYLIAFILIGLFIQFVLPQVIDSIIELINNIPSYIIQSTTLVSQLFDKYNLNDQYLSLANENIKKLVDYTIGVATELLPVLGNLLKNIAASIWNIVLGFIISIYLLKDKENLLLKCRQILYAVFPLKIAKKTIKVVEKSNYIFGKFLVGKILDSFLVGIVTFSVLEIFAMPYAILIAIIIGVTNIIPFFGPFMGAIPSFILILIVSPSKAFWFLIIILVIQQIDANLIVPKILGKSMGISAFGILFAILFAGEFFGIIGMILGVPMFAVIYSLLDELLYDKLSKKGIKLEQKNINSVHDNKGEK